jgi:hypothetical protein
VKGGRRRPSADCDEAPFSMRLAEIDAARDGPRLAWIRGAITAKFGMDQPYSAAADHTVLASPGRFDAPLPRARPPRQTSTMTRQGTLPDGSVCAHPFRDERSICRVCGHQR